VQYIHQGASETARTTSDAGSLIDLELSPGPGAPAQLINAPAVAMGQAAPPAHNGWDTFGDTGGAMHESIKSCMPYTDWDEWEQALAR
jgi:hypothetical protein